LGGPIIAGLAAGTRRAFRGAFLLALAAALTLPASPARAQAVSVRIVADGQPLVPRSDAIVQDGVVMAPYQGLSEPLGVRTTWDPARQMLTLVGPAGDELQLRPNDPYATVNGERRPIPIPLVTVLGRVLIPVQWVFDTLGDITDYDAATRTVTISAQITGITWREAGGNLDVQIDGTAPLHARARYEGPMRLVLDVTGAVARAGLAAIDVGEGPLETVTVGSTPSGAEIVFALAGPAQYRLVTDASARRAVLTLGTGAQRPPSGAAVPGQPRILSVSYQHLDGGGRVVITSTQPVRITERVLRSPDRIVLDIQNAVFVPVKQAVDANDGLVVQVRAAQFNKAPDIVRIVVQLARPTAFVVRAGADATQTVVDLGAATASAPGPGPQAPVGPRGPVVVAVDPGHGGSDPGAIGPDGVREKDVALAIAQDLRALAAQQHIDIAMVRDGDVFVPLEDRARIAQNGGATLFVSIHANASVDGTANGTQTFYYAPQSVPLARAVLDALSQTLHLVPRGVTQARFEVLVDAKVPAILVETAFVTNPREEQMLKDPASQQLFAQGILRGIQQYLAAQQNGAP